MVVVWEGRTFFFLEDRQSCALSKAKALGHGWQPKVALMVKKGSVPDQTAGTTVVSV